MITMTMDQVRNQIAAVATDDDYMLKGWIAAIDAHLSQPAQAVDVQAIKEVVIWLRTRNSETASYRAGMEQADKLARAISGEKARPVDGLSSETFGGWCNTLTHAYMYVTERSWGNAHYGIEAVLNDLREWQRKLTPPSASHAPDKEGL